MRYYEADGGKLVEVASEDTNVQVSHTNTSIRCPAVGVTFTHSS